MTTVELHGAFVWDCDYCGIENFERAIGGNIDEAALAADENQVVGELIAIGAIEVGEAFEAEILVQRVLMAPATVTCRKCGTTHQAEISTIDESDDSPGTIPPG